MDKDKLRIEGATNEGKLIPYCARVKKHPGWGVTLFMIIGTFYAGYNNIHNGSIKLALIVSSVIGVMSVSCILFTSIKLPYYKEKTQ